MLLRREGGVSTKPLNVWDAKDDSRGLLQTVEVTKVMPPTPMYLELFEIWNAFTTIMEFMLSAPVQALVQKAKPDCPWGPGLCPGCSQDDMQRECGSLDNQNEALPRTACNLFVKSLCAWAFVCALHDVLLIRGHGPHVTILVGCIGLLVQEVMAVAALWAAVDVTGVFASSVNDVWCCACYYKLDDLAAVFFLGTPIFMYATFVFKRDSLALAVVRGDCLYFRVFTRCKRMWHRQSLPCSWQSMARLRWKHVPCASCRIYAQFAVQVHMSSWGLFSGPFPSIHYYPPLWCPSTCCCWYHSFRICLIRIGPSLPISRFSCMARVYYYSFVRCTHCTWCATWWWQVPDRFMRRYL